MERIGCLARVNEYPPAADGSMRNMALSPQAVQALSGPENESERAVPLGRSEDSRSPARTGDDFSRLLTGFVLGLLLALVLGVAHLLLLGLILKPTGAYSGQLHEACLFGFLVGQLVVLSALPIVGAALLARQDRVKGARQTFCSAFSILVLFVVVCGRPLAVGAVIPVLLVGLGGLGGVCGVALWKGSR
jgi:hypothetical protein